VAGELDSYNYILSRKFSYVRKKMLKRIIGSITIILLLSFIEYQVVFSLVEKYVYHERYLPLEISGKADVFELFLSIVLPYFIFREFIKIYKYISSHVKEKGPK